MISVADNREWGLAVFGSIVVGGILPKAPMRACRLGHIRYNNNNLLLNLCIISKLLLMQEELLEKAKQKNIIVYLGTGSGKTFIAAMLMKHMKDKLLGGLQKVEIVFKKWI